MSAVGSSTVTGDGALQFTPTLPDASPRNSASPRAWGGDGANGTISPSVASPSPPSPAPGLGPVAAWAATACASVQPPVGMTVTTRNEDPDAKKRKSLAAAENVVGNDDSLTENEKLAKMCGAQCVDQMSNMFGPRLSNIETLQNQQLKMSHNHDGQIKTLITRQDSMERLTQKIQEDAATHAGHLQQIAKEQQSQAEKFAAEHKALAEATAKQVLDCCAAARAPGNMMMQPPHQPQNGSGMYSALVPPPRAHAERTPEFSPSYIEVRICDFDDKGSLGIIASAVDEWIDRFTKELGSSANNFDLERTKQSKGDWLLFTKVNLYMAAGTRDVKVTLANTIDFIQQRPQLHFQRGVPPMLALESRPENVPLKRVLGKFYGALRRLGVSTRTATKPQYPKSSQAIVEVWRTLAGARPVVVAVFSVSGWKIMYDEMKVLVGADFDLSTFQSEIEP